MADNNLIPCIPAPAENLQGRNLPIPVDYYRTNALTAAADAEQSNASMPLSRYLWILRRRWWQISLFVTSVVAATVMISMRLTPIYESTATIDIDRQTPSAIIGQESTRTVTNDPDQFIATQAKLIQSDSVLRPVAQQYHLTASETGSAEPTVPAQTGANDAPVVLKQLKVSRPPNTYLLLINYRSPDAQLAADVSNAIATVVSGAYVQHPFQIVGEPFGIHGTANGRAQVQDGAVERRTGSVRAGSQRD